FIRIFSQVQHQVNPSLVAKEDALQYIEGLILNLLGTLCVCQPHTVQDVQDRVQKTFPDPIDKWAMGDANAALEKGKKNSNIVLPVDKIHHLLIKEVLGYKIDFQVSLYIVAVLEYIAADILKLTGKYVRKVKHSEITSQDIKVAICADQVLMDMFSQEEDVSLPLMEEPLGLRTEKQTYEDIVKDFIFEETQYMRDLNQIIKVFRAPFVKHFPRSKDLEVIFSNILDIYEFTANLQSSVEEQVELAAENETPLVGICFQDMAEEEEFNVYEKYVEDMLQPRGNQRLNTLLGRNDLSQTLEAEGHGFKDAMKYVLPKLLLGPIYHCLHYFEVIKALSNASPCEEDRECLEQASGLLASLKAVLERTFSGNYPRAKPWETSLRLQGRTGRQAVVQKMSELQRSIDGWEGKAIWQSCSEFITEGILMKYTKSKSSTERHVFLFDGLIILCKQNLRRTSVTNPSGEFKLKEKFSIRKVEFRDREDTEEMKNWFEIAPKDHPNNSITLLAKSQEEKSNWMAAFITLQTRSMLERRLDSILKKEEQEKPLKLPPEDTYRFAKEDSGENIVFEERGSSPSESPLIKGGTLLKLIERLTYHMYADPQFVRTFLTTYRSFCTPEQLLDLLIERFNIPDPPANLQNDLTRDADHNQQIRDDLKRFRKEYIKPVQFRVVNVLRHWVDHHYYDFERNLDLLHKLRDFLGTVKGKAMKKMAESIIKVIRRRFESLSTEREITHQSQPPKIEWHIARKKEEFDLMTLHPIEIARQVTLLEFDLYRAVQPSELVGCAWVKETKKQNSPNLLKLIDFTNNFTFWLEKCIITTENLDERVAIMNRILEIMIVFQELNNFNGVLAVVSAIHSASVHRLEHTYDEVKYKRNFEEAKELNSERFKKYQEKLRSINPPCVPFFGMYLTNILFIEEGNPDYLPRTTDMINFSKRRKVAEITGEIQQYQNQPYCLSVEHDIREFFEKLDPKDGMTTKEYIDFLYEKSLQIEPRGALRLQKYPKKYEYSLKSPGIKPSASSIRTLAREGRSFIPHIIPTAGPSYNRLADSEDSELSSPNQTTPPYSPSMTPPHSATDNVFSNVDLPSRDSGIDSVSYASSTLSLNQGPPTHPPLPRPTPVNLQPPPLPPRKKYRDSINDIGLSRSLTSPIVSEPPIPPRGAPPVPPRRDSFHSGQLQSRHSSGHISCATLPRCAALSGGRNPSNRATFPVEFHNGNGDDKNSDSEIPKLPPKTYRTHHHTRQKSS
ncbi:hypothetical protein FSP39_024725, partial [Pinctada imbricata]